MVYKRWRRRLRSLSPTRVLRLAGKIGSGCTLVEQQSGRSGWSRRAMQRLSAPGRTREASRFDERRTVARSWAIRSGSLCAAADRREGLRAGGRQRIWARALCARRQRKGGLSQRLSDRQDQHGGGALEIFRAAGSRGDGAVCLERVGRGHLGGRRELTTIDGIGNRG